VRKFGFSDVATPRNLGIALGAGGVAPLELATGYATFANGGLKVEPYFIQRIEDSAGKVLFEAQPKLACADCNDVAAAIDPETTALVDSDTAIFPPLRRAERIISPQNAYLVTDMMKGVILRGTGRRARVLERSDLAGKTGTTNDGRDTWFAGFNADLVAVSWVGFNQDRSLGRGEEGASTALPMWISFMGEALAGVEAHAQPMPPGIGEVRINPENGLAAGNGTAVTVFEKFDLNNVPPRESDSRYGAPVTGVPDGETPGTKTQPIF
jgi:penicillin-binding protein 1A